MQDALTSLSVRYFGRHKVQVTLVLAGVALGVATYVGIGSSAASLTQGMHDTIDRVAGKAQLEVSAGETGLPEAALEKVRDVAGVEAASPVVEAVVRAPQLADASLLLLGIDFLGDVALRDWQFDGDDVLDDPLVFLAQPDSICLTREFARRNGLGRGDTLVMSTLAGAKPYKIRGLIEASGPAKGFGGNIVVMDVYAAQFTLGRGNRFDRLDVRLAEGLTLEEGKKSLLDALGPTYIVQTPERRSAQLATLVRSFAASLQLGSWQALLVAVFLIFNVFGVAAVRRRTDVGILRALGASRAQVQRLFLFEGLVLGVLGAILGIVAGRLLATGMIRLMAHVFETAFGIGNSLPVVALSHTVLLGAILLGVGGGVGGALLPARRAARIDPVAALSRGRALTGTRREAIWREVAGLAALAAGLFVSVVLAPHSVAGIASALALLHFAAILLAPTLTRWATRLLRPIFGALGGSEGRLAAEALHAAPLRTSATVIALMISVGFVVTIAGYIASMTKSYETWLDGVVTADLYVTASPQFVNKPIRMPPQFGPILAELPHVRWVEPFRSFRVEIGGRSPLVEVLPFELTWKRLTPQIVAGDRTTGPAAIARGEAIAVSNNFALLAGVSVGSPVTIPTPAGPLTLPVALVLLEYASDQGSIMLDRRVFLERFGDESADYYELIAEPGTDLGALRQSVVAALRDRATSLFIFTGPEFRHEIRRFLDQYFSFTYVQIALALIVGLLGITNTLVISVTERTHEIGVLRALGASRAQVARLVLAEALGLALVGGAAGMIFGTLILRLVAGSLSTVFTGWSVPVVFPLTFALIFTPLMLVVTLLAALYPARLATRLTPSEALSVE